MLKIFHTSPNKITRVHDCGLFGDGLCFAAQPYVMTAIKDYVTYSLDLNESEVVEARSFFYREDYTKLSEIVAYIMSSYKCDEDTAEDLLTGITSIFDTELQVSDFGEAAWELQKLALDAAKLLGFRAVKLRDEQGTMYLVSMKDREHELCVEAL